METMSKPWEVLEVLVKILSKTQNSSLVFLQRTYPIKSTDNIFFFLDTCNFQISIALNGTNALNLLE